MLAVWVSLDFIGVEVPAEETKEDVVSLVVLLEEYLGGTGVVEASVGLDSVVFEDSRILDSCSLEAGVTEDEAADKAVEEAAEENVASVEDTFSRELETTTEEESTRVEKGVATESEYLDELTSEEVNLEDVDEVNSEDEVI